MIIQKAQSDDAHSINAIYNYYVENTYATFDTEVWSKERRTQWIEELQNSDGLYNVLICKDGQSVIGFAYNSKLKEKKAYSVSTETTIYTAPNSSGQGIGSCLYQELFQMMDKRLHRAYAGIALPNENSIALHLKFGFVHVGTYSEVGFKLGQYYSVAWYEKKLT